MCLAEQFKLPLSQIARSNELAVLGGQYDPKEAQIIADSALKLIDNYMLGIELATQAENVQDWEPVAVSSVLYDSAVELKPLAKTYGIDLDLNIDGKFGPVMAHRRGLQAALVSLGCSLIESLPSGETSDLKLALTAHRCRYGLVTGIYSTNHGLSQQALRRGRQLHGQARQPLPGAVASSGAGVFVADAIFQSMNTRLFSSRHQKLRGLGAILPVNPQLQLV